MYYLTITLWTLIGLLYNGTANSQTTKRKDTIYCFIDHSDKNHNVKIYYENGIKNFQFDSPCLLLKNKPTFSVENPPKEKKITSSELKKLKLTSIKKLVRLSCKGKSGFSYDNSHITFFIEPKENYFVQYKVDIYVTVVVH